MRTWSYFFIYGVRGYVLRGTGKLLKVCSIARERERGNDGRPFVPVTLVTGGSTAVTGGSRLDTGGTIPPTAFATAVFEPVVTGACKTNKLMHYYGYRAIISLAMWISWQFQPNQKSLTICILKYSTRQVYYHDTISRIRNPKVTIPLLQWDVSFDNAVFKAGISSFY